MYMQLLLFIVFYLLSVQCTTRKRALYRSHC